MPIPLYCIKQEPGESDFPVSLELTGDDWNWVHLDPETLAPIPELE